MRSFRQLGAVNLHAGVDCLEVIRELADCSMDSIVTDPPYGLGFMGKAWDDLPPGEEWAKQCLRVLKPGGHLLAFGGSRTWHRLAVAVEDAGFEIRDSIAWLYGSGFPKSLDVSKAIDKARDDKAHVLAVTSQLADLADSAGVTHADLDAHMGTSDMGGWWLSRLAQRCACPSVENWMRLRDFIPGAHDLDDAVWRLNGRKGTWGNEREDRAVSLPADNRVFQPTQRVDNAGTPATDDAKAWQGWGTALKPAFEPIVVGRKPLVGTVAANVLAHGTGALNIDACRVTGEASAPRTPPSIRASTEDWRFKPGTGIPADAGRWPANVVLDDSQAAAIDAQSGTLTSGANPKRRGVDGDRTAYGEFAGQDEAFAPRGVDSGGASRFFPTFRYQAKAPARERPKVDGIAHPTVKPLELMRWLVRLVTPPGGIVLEPFAGSGTTVEACLLENVFCIAIERDETYAPLVLARIERVLGLTPGWL